MSLDGPLRPNTEILYTGPSRMNTGCGRSTAAGGSRLGVDLEVSLGDEVE